MRKQFSTRLRRQKSFRQKLLNSFSVAILVAMPVYPVFGSYMQSYTGVTVRGDYDNNTIISAYQYGTTPDASGNQASEVVEGVAQEEPINTIAAETIVINNPQPQDVKKPLYATHTVVKGDTLGGIAQKYSLSIDTLRSVNSLSTDTLSLNQKIIIPRINGVNYVVKKGDTLSVIAEKYGVKNLGDILLANDMADASRLSVGKTLLIPNPTKDPNKKPETPQIAQVQTKNPAQTKPAVAVKPTAAPKSAPVATKTVPAKDPATITYGNYTLNLKVEKGCRNFVWGNCTCFVAKYKNVTWRGNAKDWLKNAKKAGVPTGQDPKPGAIIVYHGPGFPPAYGHVGIVMEVNDDGMIIKDMNYRALNEITTRKESFTNKAILGYIYVD